MSIPSSLTKSVLRSSDFRSREVGCLLLRSIGPPAHTLIVLEWGSKMIDQEKILGHREPYNGMGEAVVCST